MTHRYAGLAGGRRTQLRLPLSPLKAEMALSALEDWRQPDGGDRPRGWYQIGNQAGDAPTQVNIFDEISWWGISAQEFVDDLAQITGPIEVHINSPGGDAFDGITIYNALASRDGVTTVADGLAASAASVIFMAGKVRVASPGSMVMIHDALALCIGNAADMRETAGLLDKVSDNIASVYAAHTSTSAADWRAAMIAEGWYTADETVQAGLAHKVAERPGAGTEPGAAPDPEAAAGRSIFTNWLRGRPAAEDGGGDDGGCGSCGGTGKARHPETGKFTGTCPDCQGTGKAGGAASNSADDDDDGTVECPLCEGSGKIREGHVTCPDCKGTGRIPEDQADNRAPARVLGIESMPITAEAIPVHHTATVDEPWDGPAAVAAMPAEYADLHYCHAWQTAEADASSHTPGDDDADDKKGNYKFPHHKTKGGPANVSACRAILANLAGGRTPADIPDADKAGVKAHAQAHLDDAAKDGGADDHADHGLSEEALANLGTALKGAFA